MLSGQILTTIGEYAECETRAGVDGPMENCGLDGGTCNAGQSPKRRFFLHRPITKSSMQPAQQITSGGTGHKEKTT